MRAEVILMKCPESKKIFGVRTEERNGDWVRTWAFKVNERTAANEGFDKTIIRGNLYADDDYNGCPYCKAINFVRSISAVRAVSALSLTVLTTTLSI